MTRREEIAGGLEMLRQKAVRLRAEGDLKGAEWHDNLCRKLELLLLGSDEEIDAALPHHDNDPELMRLPDGTLTVRESSQN